MTSSAQMHHYTSRFVWLKDAYKDALPFYYKQGFAPLSKEDEDSDTRLLYFDLESVRTNKE